MNDTKTSTQSRLLSLAEDQSVNSNEMGKKSYLAPPAVGQPVIGGKSKLNAPRVSVFNRRFSHSMSYSSRKSSQDMSLTRTRYQNTYRLYPDENSKFYAYKVEPKIYSTLEHCLKGRYYDQSKCCTLAKELSDDIVRETRNCLSNTSRYKLLAHVSIGQQLGHDVTVTSRCLWGNKNNLYL
jgi:hypothetical protein